MKAFLPRPLLSLLLGAIWLLLNNSISWEHFLLAALLGISIPLLVQQLQETRHQRIRLGKLSAYCLLVLWDILVANLQVARLILGPVKRLQPAFIKVPLRITEPQPLVWLAGTITLTPGTVSCDVSEDGTYLLVHVLHLEDEEAMVEEIQQRYERRLKEIFSC